MGLFGIGVSEVVNTTKKVIGAILEWIWSKIKEWAIANWKIVIIAILVLFVVGLVKLLLLKLQLTPVLRDLGLLKT